MAQSCTVLGDSPDNRFAVYCGRGVYVTGVQALQTSTSFIHTGPVEKALAASRRVAIGALHEARRAGLTAWLVRHPERAGVAL